MYVEVSGEHVMAELAQARALFEQRDYASSVILYQGLLSDPLSIAARHEARSNSAMALLYLARSAPPSKALAMLERARKLVLEALDALEPVGTRRDWLQMRGQLVMIYLTRHDIAGRPKDLLLAHLALDDTQQSLEHAGASEMPVWIAVMRQKLAEQRTRRRSRRL